MFMSINCKNLNVNLGNTEIKNAIRMFYDVSCDNLTIKMFTDKGYMFDDFLNRSKINYLNLKNINITSKFSWYSFLFDDFTKIKKIIMPTIRHKTDNTKSKVTSNIKYIYCNEEWVSFFK